MKMHPNEDFIESTNFSSGTSWEKVPTSPVVVVLSLAEGVVLNTYKGTERTVCSVHEKLLKFT